MACQRVSVGKRDEMSVDGGHEAAVLKTSARGQVWNYATKTELLSLPTFAHSGTCVDIWSAPGSMSGEYAFTLVYLIHLALYLIYLLSAAHVCLLPRMRFGCCCEHIL
jgi:hypothetical protein